MLSTDSFKKEKITGQASENCGKDGEIMIPLKYLSNFWRTLEIFLINSEINLHLNWFKNCVIVAKYADQGTTFSITDAKLYVTLVTLSTQDNAKLLEQLKSSFKRKINWNEHQSKQKDKTNI